MLMKHALFPLSYRGIIRGNPTPHFSTDKTAWVKTYIHNKRKEMKVCYKLKLTNCYAWELNPIFLAYEAKQDIRSSASFNY